MVSTVARQAGLRIRKAPGDRWRLDLVCEEEGWQRCLADVKSYQEALDIAEDWEARFEHQPIPLDLPELTEVEASETVAGLVDEFNRVVTEELRKFDKGLCEIAKRARGSSRC